MLQAIRDRLVGWVAWGIVILISVPFIIMGVTDFGSPAAKTVVAEVGDETIDQSDYQRRFQARRQSMQKQFGANYRADIFDPKIRQNVVEAMVDEKLLSQLIEKNNLQIGDRELSSVIRTDESFMQDGKFDYKLYQSKLAQSGFTTESYERYLRDDRQLNAIPRLLRQSSFITQQESQRYYQLLNQRRDIDYIIIGEQYFPDKIKVSEEQARAYYDANTKAFIRPAQVMFEYVQLSANILAAGVAVTEENIQRYYEENIQKFVVDEQRKASHILLLLEEGKSLEDSPEVAGKLKTIREKLDAGSAFESLAKEYSDDPGSAQQGGSLGQVLRGVMVPPFETALFAMQNPGEVSEPIRTSFGIHLIRLDNLTPKQVKPFDEVKAELTQDFAKTQAIELYYDQSERMAEISYENPDSLIPVAEVLGLKVQSSSWVSTDNDTPGIEGNKDVLRTAFNDRSKTEMTNSDPIEVGVNDAVIIRVIDSREASQKPFEDVTDLARAAAREGVMAEKIKAYAGVLHEQIKSGASWQSLADEKKLTIETADALQRQGNGLPVDLSRGVFAMSAPIGNNPRVEIIELANAAVALVQLRNIDLPEATDVSGTENSLHSNRALRDAQMLLAGMKENTKIIIYKDKL